MSRMVLRKTAAASLPPVSISYVGATSLAGSVVASMPAHVPGDLFLAYASLDGSTTAPVIPAGTPGYMDTFAIAGTSCSMVYGYKIAATSAEASGTWTNSTGLAIGIYRKDVEDAEWMLPQNGAAALTGTGATINLPPTDTETTITTPHPAGWWYSRCAFSRNATNLTTNNPAGWSARTGVATEIRLLDTGGAVATEDAETIGGNSIATNGSTGWISTTYWVGARRITGMPLWVASSYNVGTTTTLPTQHRAGDLLIMYAFNNASTTIPTLPAGWTNINTGAANVCASRVAYKIAASSSETSGTWTNAAVLCVEVWRHAAIGADAVNGGTGTAIGYPALTLNNTSGSSRAIRFGAHKTNLSLGTMGTMTDWMWSSLSQSGFGHLATFRPQLGLTSNVAAYTQTATASNGWRTHTIEVTYAP